MTSIELYNLLFTYITGLYMGETGKDLVANPVVRMFLSNIAEAEKEKDNGYKI